MAETKSFDHVCAELEAATSLDRLETRGTVRLALKDAGLDASSVSVSEMQVVLQKVLPGELRSRGVDDADALCARIADGLDAIGDEARSDTPEAIFRRLAGD